MFALFLNSGTRFMSICFVKMNICSVGQAIHLRLQTNICHDVIKHWTLFFFFPYLFLWLLWILPFWPDYKMEIKLNPKNDRRHSGELLPFPVDRWPLESLRGCGAATDAHPRRESLAADCGRKTHCGMGEGVPLCDLSPGHPVDFRSRVAMVDH